MIAALLLIMAGHLTSTPGPTQDPLGEVRSLWGQGRFAEALVATEAIEAPASRYFERLEVLYHAGDLGAALGAGLKGLAVEPDHLMLLWRSAGLALDLGAGKRGLELSERLARAVETSTALGDQERDDWRAAAETYLERARSQEALAREREGALTRARWTVAGILVGALGCILLGWRTG